VHDKARGRDKVPELMADGSVLLDATTSIARNHACIGQNTFKNTNYFLWIGQKLTHASRTPGNGKYMK
jgi:hypothetical protein